MRAGIGVGVAVLAALATFPASATAQQDPTTSAEEHAAAVARPSVVLVQTVWHGWVRDKQTGEVFGGASGFEVTVSCSGTVINPDGYVATASHCVHTGVLGGSGALFDAAIAELAKAGRIGDPAKAKQSLAERATAEGATPDSPVDRQIRVERMVGPDRDVAPATVVDLVAPDDGDVAVLRIPRDRLPALELRPDPPPVGTPVLSVGLPSGPESPVDPNLEPSSLTDTISASRTEGDRPFYEIRTGAQDGMNGGPVVDLDGRVVGLVSTVRRDEYLTFASAASTLTEVLRGKDIAATIGASDRNYRTGLDRYFAGELDSAVEFFDAVLADTPANEPAARYRQRAIDQGGVAGGSTTLLVALVIGCAGVGVAAAAVATAMVIIGRRRLASTMDTPPFGIPLPVEAAAPPPAQTVAEPAPAPPPAAVTANEALTEVAGSESPTVVTGSGPPAPPPPDPRP